MTSWEYVKEFYKKHFGIEGWVVELYANIDPLSLCAAGASNKTIAELCQMDLDDVVELLMNTFKFPGWTEDLPLDPYKVYKNICKDYESQEKANVKFLEEMLCEFRAFPTQKAYATQATLVCETMKEIEERIADEWI